MRSDCPLILLANRDEFYSRPTEPAHYWLDHPEVLAGRDLVSGGTWLGVTKGGRFACVTNYRDPAEAKRTSSRGDLVAAFLKSNISANEYLRSVSAVRGEFAGFNLLLGEINSESNELYYYSNRQDEITNLAPGTYGLSNHLLDTRWPKIEVGKRELSDCLKREVISNDLFFEILADETLADDNILPDTGVGYDREKSMSAIFIKTLDYGTRCSTVLRFDAALNFDLDERVFV